VTVSGEAVSGILTGQVTLANSEAVITLTGSKTNGVTTSDGYGRYDLPLLADTYTLNITKPGHTAVTISNIAITAHGMVVTQNVTLTGSEFVFAPHDISEDLVFGQTVTNSVLVINNGSVDAAYTARVVTTRSPADYVPPGPGVQCYTEDLYDGHIVTFNIADPTNITRVVQANINAPYSTEFLGNDFSSLYVFANRELQRINVLTGERTAIGDSAHFTGHAWYGSAYDPVEGVFYAVSSPGGNGSPPCVLMTIDPETGKSSIVAAMSGGNYIHDIAIDGEGRMYGIDKENATLLSIDKHTGEGTVIAPLGYNAISVQSIDFDEVTGKLYLLAIEQFDSEEFRIENRLCELNPQTGESSVLAVYSNRFMVGLAVSSGGGGDQWINTEQIESTIPAHSYESFNVVLNARAVTLPGEYKAAIRFNGTYVNDMSNLSVTMNVQADSLAITPAQPLHSAGPKNGPFTPETHTYVLTNQGTASLN